MNFGTVSPDTHADATSYISLTCQAAQRPGYIRYCVQIAEGEPIAGIAPRWLTNYNGARMKYDIYADPARSSLVGPPPAGGGYPRYSGLLHIAAANATAGASIPLYGRAPAGQVLPATNPFQSQITGSKIAWAFDPDRDPGSCDGTAVRGQASFYLGVKALTSNSCRVTLVSNLDFGSAPSRFPAIASASNIVLRCPAGTAWMMGLNNGRNAAGGRRRMVSADGSHITYELYQDAARTKRWGDIDSGDAAFGLGTGETTPATLKVYGQVPAASGPKGRYTDTITITLEF